MARLAHSGCRWQSRAGADRLRRRRGAVVARTDHSVAGRLRKFRARANWKRRIPTAADRCPWRGHRCDGSGAQGRHGNHRAGRALRPVVLEYLSKAWRELDEGIWEVRGGRQHFVHSKVMAWVAFDRAANGFAADGSNESAQHWRKIAHEIHADTCERRFDHELNPFVQAYGSKRLDARLLLIPLVGFLPLTDR